MRFRETVPRAWLYHVLWGPGTEGTSSTEEEEDRGSIDRVD